MTRRRLAAALAVLLVPAGLALGVALAIVTFPRGIFGLALLALAAVALWQGLIRRGVARVAGVGAGLLLAAGVVALLVSRQPVLVLAAVAVAALAPAAARVAFRI